MTVLDPAHMILLYIQPATLADLLAAANAAGADYSSLTHWPQQSIISNVVMCSQSDEEDPVRVGQASIKRFAELCERQAAQHRKIAAETPFAPVASHALVAAATLEEGACQLWALVIAPSPVTPALLSIEIPLPTSPRFESPTPAF